jgi:hypothetical protein
VGSVNRGSAHFNKKTAASNEFAATATIGLAETTPADRRIFFDTLRLLGRVLADSGGLPLGRTERFRIEWEARNPLVHTAVGLLKREIV